MDDDFDFDDHDNQELSNEELKAIDKNFEQAKKNEEQLADKTDQSNFFHYWFYIILLVLFCVMILFCVYYIVKGVQNRKKWAELGYV
jgi:quinol-cytochrome oxidoreductase complex cytochrome b subunit